MSIDLKRWTSVRPGYWFAPRLFGFGATPVTWEGWLFTLVTLAIIVLIARSGMAAPPKTALLVLLLGLLLWVSWRKTDGSWRWRWGSMDR